MLERFSNLLRTFYCPALNETELTTTEAEINAFAPTPTEFQLLEDTF